MLNYKIRLTAGRQTTNFFVVFRVLLETALNNLDVSACHIL